MALLDVEYNRRHAERDDPVGSALLIELIGSDSGPLQRSLR